MTFPLLEYYLRCKNVSELKECVRLAGASPNPRGRKDDLIDALLQVCRTASVHERLWDCFTDARDQERNQSRDRAPASSWIAIDVGIKQGIINRNSDPRGQARGCPGAR